MRYKYYCWECQKTHFYDSKKGKEHVKYRDYMYWRQHRFDKK